jgi:tetratricopeptide (TPR) repeat protein
MQVYPHDPDLIHNAGGYEAYPVGMVRMGRRSAGHGQQSMPLCYVNGACMFARLSAVEEFGLLDEGMVVFASDADWSLTARSRGWEAWYCAEAVVQHEIGVSGGLPDPALRARDERDRDYFRRKWAGSILLHELNRLPGQAPPAESLKNALHTAQEHLDAQRWGEAEMICRDVLAADPGNFTALVMLGRLIWTRYQNATIAGDFFAQAVKVAPQDADVRLYYAMALDVMGHPDEAVKEYSESARLEVRNPRRLEEIAARLQALGRESEAAIVRQKGQALKAAPSTTSSPGTPGHAG